MQEQLDPQAHPLEGDTAVASSGMAKGLSSRRAELDRACAQLLRGEIPLGMHTLLSMLGRTRAALTPDDWKAFCRDVCLQHPIRHLVHQEPYTRRSFDKPRRYAGDAVLLDFLYQGLRPEQHGPSVLGQGIYDYLSQQTSSNSLRGRLALLARWIDATAERVPAARILSIACGHLREARLSRAVRERRLGRFVAFDQDKESLAVVHRELGPFGVETVQGSVKALLRGEIGFDPQDFVYAAGLYDYLRPPMTLELTRLLFSLLRPGGRLLLANYSDSPTDSDYKAYMEAFMDWWLIYRDEPELETWSQDIPRAQLAGQRLFRDETKNLIYLELIRR